MSEHFKATIADLQAELKKQEDAVVEKKKLINMLCSHAGMTPIYPDAELTAASRTLVPTKTDQVHAQRLIPAIRQILQMRPAPDPGPATISEIHSPLIPGNFIFATQHQPTTKQRIATSVTKNSSVF